MNDYFKKAFFVVVIILMIGSITSFYFFAISSSETKLNSSSKNSSQNIDYTRAYVPENLRDPAPTLDYKDLQKRLDNNDFCNFSPEKYKFSDQVKALMQAPDIFKSKSEHDKAIADLFNGGPLTMNEPNLKPVKNNDWLFRFYEALTLGNYMANFGDVLTMTRDAKKADEILKHLEEKNSDNGVFAFVRAGLLKRINANSNEVRSELLNALNAPNFNTYTKLIGSRLKQKGFKNTTYYLLAANIISKMSIPLLNESYDVLLKYAEAEKDPALLIKAEAFAYRMYSQNIPRYGRYELVLWDSLSYANSVRILPKLWKIRGTPENSWLKLKKFDEIVD